MVEKLDFSFDLARPKSTFQSAKIDNKTMRILILGDFSGIGLAACEQRQSGNRRHPVIPIDADNFDRVMSQFEPRFRLQPNLEAKPAIDLTFRRLEDFRPDSLLHRVELFQGLLGIRERLNDPATFDYAVEQLRQNLPIAADIAVKRERKTIPENDAATLERLLGESPADFRLLSPATSTSLFYGVILPSFAHY